MRHLAYNMKNKQLNILGLAGLILFAAGALPSLSWLTLPGLIVLMYLYLAIDKLGFGSKLFKISLVQLIFALPAMGFVAYVNLDHNLVANNQSLYYVSLAIVVGCLLFLAYTSYLVALNLLLLGKNSNNMWFKISGVLTKVGAFTMPVLGLGFLFLVLAQPIFLLGCITYKPLVSVD